MEAVAVQTHPTTVLVVDDDAEIRTLLATLLNAVGWRVLLAGNGHEAFQVLATEPRPCVILLDLMMPVMSGVEFRERQMRDAALSSIPVVFFSALGEVVKRAEELGAAGYVRKPFDPDALMDALACRCQRGDA